MTDTCNLNRYAGWEEANRLVYGGPSAQAAQKAAYRLEQRFPELRMRRLHGRVFLADFRAALDAVAENRPAARVRRALESDALREGGASK
ncbi:MAG: hypothetical protein RLY93_19830 [Sumerlaeia bacterium]